VLRILLNIYPTQHIFPEQLLNHLKCILNFYHSKLVHVLIFRVHGSIPTKGKNSTKEDGGEVREVTVPGPSKVVVPGLLQERGANDLRAKNDVPCSSE
jgi:hypothetical protein